MKRKAGVAQKAEPRIVGGSTGVRFPPPAPRNNEESLIVAQIRLALGKIPGVVLYRNAQLTTKVGDKWIKSGLGTGTPDLVGFVSVEITPEMVGKRVAIATGIEVKTPRGRLSEEQKQCLKLWSSSGALAFRSDDVETAVKEVSRLRG